MNVRKPIDYSAMFATLDELMAANLPQMELYRGIGCVVQRQVGEGRRCSRHRISPTRLP